MNDLEKKQVGKRINDIRVARKETLEEFAQQIRKETSQKIKTTKSNVSKWEKGLNIPNDITIKAISNLGNVSVEFLLNGENPSDTQLNELKDAILNSIMNDSYKDAAHKIQILSSTRAIDFDLNEDSMALNNKLKIIKSFFSKIENNISKINSLELDLLVESISMIEEIKNSNVSDKQQYNMYNLLLEAIREIRKKYK